MLLALISKDRVSRGTFRMLWGRSDLEMDNILCLGKSLYRKANKIKDKISDVITYHGNTLIYSMITLWERSYPFIGLREMCFIPYLLQRSDEIDVTSK